MRTLPISFSRELIESEIFLRHLIRINLPDESSLYWTDCDQSIVTTGGISYLPKAIEFTPMTASIMGKVDNITLYISNVDKAISDLVLDQDIRGSECLIWRVLLDENIQMTIGPSLMFYGFIDKIDINRGKATIQIFNHLIKWRLLTPRRLHSVTCPWTFKGTECGYTGAQPICDRNASTCKLLGRRENFGGFYHVTKLAQKELWWGEKSKIWQQTFR